MSKDLPDHPDYYRKLPSEFKVEVDGYRIEPMAYQPTPKGLLVLSDHYKDKYGVDIRIIDHTDSVEKGDNLKFRFQEFKKYLDANKGSLEEELATGKQVGFILSHGFNHVVPLMLSLDKNGDKVMTIFDSSSGSRIKGYHIISNIMEDFTVLLNKGTRQSDGYSCSNDSIAILKDALRMTGLAQYILDHKVVAEDISEPPSDGRPTFFITPLKNPDKFKIFLMPEELLKTSQSNAFVDAARPDFTKIITISNKTLEQKRGEGVTTVSLNKRPEVEIPINHYLHDKGRKYAEIICNHLEKKVPPSPDVSASRGASPLHFSEEDLFKV